MIVFSKQWFKKHQKKLLFLLKFKLFRWVLRIDTKSEIVWILPNAYFIKGTKENEYVADFRTHDKYAKRLYYSFKPLWHVIHFWDMEFANRVSKQLNFGFDTLTVYPSPGVTVDGVIARDVASEDWATLHDSTGNTVDDTNTVSTVIRIKSDTTTDMWEIIYRAVFLFDTSALDDAANISATVLSLYGFGKTDGLSATPNIDIYTSTPASNTALANGDYLQVGTTSQTGSPITYASWSTSAYNAFTFNATGRGNVSLTGISKFGARNANYDVANTPPTWSSGATSHMQCYFSDEAGTSSDPKLVVTYTVASASSGNMFMVF